MTETPQSDKFDRLDYSSHNIIDLDDHRFQPSSLPRANTMDSTGAPAVSPGARRGTLASIVHDRPELLQELQGQDFVARDFEQAIAEDEKSIHSAHDNAPGSSTSPSSPVLGRKNTARRPQQRVEPPTLSRASSASTASSHPESVAAFADALRRQRTGTVSSLVAPDQDLALQRTTSGGTHGMRPILSDDRSIISKRSSASTHTSAEEDVCYPQPEEAKADIIDFEELDDFLAEQAEKNTIADSVTTGVPDIVIQAPTLNGVLVDASLGESDVDEKSGKPQEVVDETPASEATVHEPVEKRWTFLSIEMQEAIYSRSFGGLLDEGESFRTLFDGPVGDIWWLDALNPSEEEVTVICKAFGIHPLTREDIVTQEPREKVELFRKYYFASFRSFNPFLKPTDEDYLDPISFYAVVFREGLLTFSYSPNKHAAMARQRIMRLRDYMAISADWICYALIDDIVDSFSPVITDVEKEVDAIEDQVFIAREEDSRKILQTIGGSRKKVMSLLRLLGGKADVIKGFAKRCNENYSVAPRGDVGMYLSDIQDHIVTMTSNLAHFEKMLSRTHSNYLAQVSVDSVTQGTKMNKWLAKVTMFATIIVPLNVVTGLFGMNVPVPGGVEPGTYWMFGGIVGVIFVFVFGCLGFARWKKMI